MSCAVCGTALVPGAHFCYQCGAPQEAGGVEDAERRRVTVLFGDLSDFTSWAEDLDPERVGVVTDRVLAALAAIVTESGGHVDKLTGDGIMAVFGAPVAHEDDPERAVLAAAAMQEQVTQLVVDESGGGRRLGLRVGLNTGVVFAGIQGHLSYTVVGDTVNTASRLSDAAGVGAVFAGRDTATATMQAASWRRLRPLRLKGKREPVEAYELVGLRSDVSRRPGVGDEVALVAREAELGTLIGRFHQVVEQRTPATMLVLGDAGVGKSRLLAEFGRYVNDVPGCRVLWGRCSPYRMGRDLGPFAQMVRVACGIEPLDTADVAQDRLRRLLIRLDGLSGTNRLVGRWAVYLAILGLENSIDGGPSREAPRDLVMPGPRGDGEVDALVALFQALALEGPLVTIIDNVHDAAPTVVNAMRDVGLRMTGPVLSVGIARTMQLEQWPQADDAVLRPEVVPVEPLDDRSMERLLGAFLGGAQLPANVRERLVARAQGNPFFLAELLQLLIDQAVLRLDDDGAWQVDGPLPDDQLPAGVQAVLAARIDSLEPQARALLRDASVIGDSFPAEALPGLDARLDTNAVEALLTVLAARGILRPEGDGRWNFVSTLAREVAYAGLPKRDRARRHAATARWAAEHGTSAAVARDVVVAVQAERAVKLAQEMKLAPSDPAWAVGRLGIQAAIRTGQQALRRDDNQGAEAHLLRALRIAAAVHAPDVDVQLATVGLAASYTGQRRLDEAESMLTTPLVSDFPNIRAAALTVLGDLRYKSGELEASRTALVQAFVQASDAGLDELTSAALRQLGLLDFLEGRLASAEDRFREALDLARRVGDDRGAAWTLQHLAWSATSRGEFEVAIGALDEAREVFTTLEDIGGTAWCAGTEALIRLLQGRLGQARELVGGLLVVAEQLQAGWEVAACRCIDALAAVDIGDIDVAAAELAGATLTFDALGDSWGQTMAAIGDGYVARARGLTREATTALRRATQLAGGDGHRPLQLMAEVTLGLVHLDRGDIRAAAAAAGRADALRHEVDIVPEILTGLWVLHARVCRFRGELAEAAVMLERTVADDVPTFLFPRRQAYAHLAATYLEQGRLDDARRTITRALDEPAEDVRSKIVARRVEAEILWAGGDEVGAVGAARRALEHAERSGYLGEIPATRRLLERLPG